MSTEQSSSRAVAWGGWAGALLLVVAFAVFPLLSLFQQNQTDIELGVLWWPLLLCVAGAIVLFGILVLLFKRSAKAALIASLVVVAFLYYGILSGHFGLRDRWFLPLWLAVLVLGVFALARTKRDLSKLAVVVGVGALVLVAGPIARIAIYQARHPVVSAADPRLWREQLATPIVPSGTHAPDIYLLVPDDYARRDVLRRYFHYTDAAFVRELKARGFVVSEQARSPYSDSEMNVAAAVNMGYLDGLGRILGTRSNDVRPVRRLIADSRASRLLKAAGYRYVHLDTDEVTFPVGNPRVPAADVPDSLVNLWLQKSVLRVVGGPIGFDQHARDSRFRDAVRSGFSRLVAVVRQPGPKFVLFHTLVPHDPYVFGARGQAVSFPYHSDQALGSRLGMPYYLRQLKFLNTKLLETVDAIKASSRRPAVIVIQSDEGFQADPDTFGKHAMQQVRVKGFEALFLPGGGGATPEPPITVNTLRFVLNRYLGTHYPLLPARSYPELDYPYQFEAMRVD